MNNSFPSASPLWTHLRIGGLHYRNALPLQRGLEAASYVEGTPAEMAAAFARGGLDPARGGLDLALLPVAAIIQGRWEAGMVPGVAIAADGPAYSVYVTWPKDCDPAALVVHPDPASRSSNVLYEVLRREVDGFGERFRPLSLEAVGEAVGEAAAEDEPCARVLIGDPAVAFRRAREEDHEFLDLAALWKEHTGLPFVFARWVSRDPQPWLLADCLASLRDENLATLEAWTSSWEEGEFWRKYLRGLTYCAGEKEEEGLRIFAAKARQYHLLA